MADAVLPGMSTPSNVDPEVELDATEGLEEINLTDNGYDTAEEETDGTGDAFCGCNFAPENAINGVDELEQIDFNNVITEDLIRFHFPDVGVAFMFYNWYGSSRGFSARKSKVLKNRNGQIIQQIFVCYKEGYREAKYCYTTNRKREPRPTSRCGCDARCKVHVEANSGRWYIKYINDVHNHTMVPVKFKGMLPAHRKMGEHDKTQMTEMRKVGIRTPHIHSYLASQAGGYDQLGYFRQDIYNEQLRDLRTPFTDAKVALDFLQERRLTDDMLFWRHTIDALGRLEHLFWCDGIGQKDYTVFGDVVAFDATYKKNKYLCPLVVFSGVNHHNQSIVFASAIVSNETEQTYLWLLEQFLTAMGGKSPVSVITDGDLAMRNAIRKIFPNAHHMVPLIL